MSSHIDKGMFLENLHLTQLFCAEQELKTYKNIASMFRTYNPTLGEKKLFDFEFQNYSSLPAAIVLFPKWNMDPLENEEALENLFVQQLKGKMDFPYDPFLDLEINGRIMAVEADNSVTDGASEAQSFGFIDVYDLPPIDTWFYFQRLGNQGILNRILFAWVPQRFVPLVQDAIDVNCMDCIHWFDEFLPEEFKRIMH